MTDRKNSTLGDIDRRFIQRLQTFASKGYRFDGSDHALKAGTQYEAFDSYLNGLKAKHRHGYFDIPTGVGKTAVFMSLIENYLDAANGHEDGKRVLVVVPNITLVKQTANAFAKFMPEIAPKLEADDDSGHPIDWENSQIGVQYNKLKHADKKPRVLITTYASLARDKENKVYNPDDFGLVVYDEGHSITAAESGKAVGKFKNALQLAVTATPDYDDDEKRVGQKLAHCYYRLPLAEAINRGDLCGVRPILIKTNYTVDANKVEEYLNANGGKPLSDAQLQNLFNVEARNRSVIDTYLADRDPDSGERFLGQQGLIFSGGITHANDLVAQFHKALGEERFAKIRRWLEMENLEVVAAIHSGTKGAWLRPGLMADEDGNALPNRKRDGQREWYSEDEVRLLHEQGKILLLISDKKLREGYDCPKDSFVVDMVDRLSVVDVTQRFGRGFRLDPDDPDKVCTPINLVDANTHEIYKDRPQMLPIYAAEILEGAEFRQPMKRHLMRKYTHEIPEADKALDHGNFEIISDQEAVRRHSNRQQRPEKIPKAKSGWMSGVAIGGEYGGSSATHTASIQVFGQEKLTALISAGMGEAEAGREVEDKWVQWARSKFGSETWYVSPEGIQELIQTGKVRTDRAPKAKPGWVSGSAILNEYGGRDTTHTASIQALGLEKLAALIAAGMSDAEAGLEVEEKWVQWARPKSGNETWHTSPEGLQELIQTGKVRTDHAPEAKPGWVSGSAIQTEYKGANQTHTVNIRALGREKLAALIAAGMDEAEAGRDVEDNWVQLASKKGRDAWHVSPQGLQELIQAGKVRTNRAPEAKPGWVSGHAIREEYSGVPATYEKNILALQEEKLAGLIAAGIDEAEAARKVEEKWVQWARTKQGPEAWHTSPEGLQELIQAGKVRTDRAPEARPGWVSGNAIRKAYGGTDTTHTASIQALGLEKLAALIAAGMDETGAGREVEDKWVQWARTKQGSEVWHVSPEGLQELIEQGKVRTDRARRNSGAGTGDTKDQAPGVDSNGNDGQSWATRTGPTNPEPMKRTGRKRGGSDADT